MENNTEKKHMFDDPRNLQRLLKVFFASLVVLFGLDLVVEKHSHFPWEDWFGFYAIYGFIACVLLVLAARYVLRPLVMRREDFYDE
ncbi:hypothetical protein [Desulfocurvus sp. DL9XJH121]